MNMYLRGIRGLCASRKGTICLFILACITGLCADGKLDGTAYGVVCTVLGTIFMHTQAKTDQAAMANPTLNTPYEGPR